MTSRVFEPNHRCAVMKSISACSLIALALVFPQLEPEEPPRPESEEIRKLSDPREARPAEHLLRDHSLPPREIELDRLGRARRVVHAEDGVVLVAADVGEDARVVRAQRLVCAEAEDGVLLPQRDESPQPA